MDFYIQASNPSFLESRQFDGEGLASAIESAFPDVTEDAFLFWRCSSIPLSYKYQLSYIVSDLPYISNILLKSSTGRFVNAWPDSDFPCNWTFDWSESDLTIHSSSRDFGWWDVLASAGPVKSDVKSFLAEMQRPAMICHRALISLNYSAQTVEGMGELEEFLKIPLPGGHLNDNQVRLGQPQRSSRNKRWVSTDQQGPVWELRSDGELR